MSREQCQATIALENAKNDQNDFLPNRPKNGKKPDG